MSHFIEMAIDATWNIENAPYYRPATTDILSAQPSAILHHIFSSFVTARADLCNLALCCRAVCDVVQPILFRELRYGLFPNNNEIQFNSEKLLFAVTKNPKLLEYIREFTIYAYAADAQPPSLALLTELVLQHSINLQNFNMNCRPQSHLSQILEDPTKSAANRWAALTNTKRIGLGIPHSTALFFNLFNAAISLERVYVSFYDNADSLKPIPRFIVAHPRLSCFHVCDANPILVAAVLEQCAPIMESLLIDNKQYPKTSQQIFNLPPMPNMKELTLANVDSALEYAILMQVDMSNLCELEVGLSFSVVEAFNKPSKDYHLHCLKLVGSYHSDLEAIGWLIKSKAVNLCRITMGISTAHLLLPLLPSKVCQITIQEEEPNQAGDEEWMASSLMHFLHRSLLCLNPHHNKLVIYEFLPREDEEFSSITHTLVKSYNMLTYICYLFTTNDREPRALLSIEPPATVEGEPTYHLPG